MSTAVRSHAKINLGLGIGAPRADGFHALCTVYQTLEVFDLVTVTAQPSATTKLRLTSNDARVPRDGRNTAWKMVELALEALGVAAEVNIHIEKRLPVQGGLGAGSANAVAALIGLEQELWFFASKPLSAPTLRRTLSEESRENVFTPNWLSDCLPGNRPFDRGEIQGTGAGISFDSDSDWPSRRFSIAAKVGSDVPLFLIGGAILGLDRGQEVYPLPDFEQVWCVVALPEVGVSTPQAFRDWDALCAEEGLTSEASTDKLNKLSRAYASAFAGGIPQGRQRAGSSGVLLDEGNLAGPSESALVRTGITSWIANDFERVVFRQHPSLAEMKRILAASGTPEASLHASLSGSGSALFGLYRTQGDAEAAQERLRAAGVKSLLTRTLPRAKYWREMLLV
jgi:4-diphosphocytidyl-2-C-methyl-D-erythritol kinase